MDNVVVRKARRLPGFVRMLHDKGGAKGVVTELGDYAWSYASYPFLHQKRSAEPFHVFGRSIPYVRHHFNRAWRNERSVELALAHDFLAGTPPGRTLEIGNVMSHYGPVDHDILDRYEEAPGVINEDVVDHSPPERYHRVLSISTLEHVGWDERPRDPEKVLRAIDNMRRMLAPGGAVLVTAALGQNPHLDEYVRSERLGLPVQVLLRRISDDNRWVEVDLADTEDARYGSPYKAGNVLFVGVIPVGGGWPYHPVAS